MTSPDAIARARANPDAALGELLNSFRTYLVVVAYGELDPGLRAKAGGSDLVQDTLLEAHAGFAAFRGGSPAELRAWLLQILRNNLENLRRRFATRGRCVALEQAVDDLLPCCLPRPLIDADTPSGQAGRREDDAAVHAALRRLPDVYRRVLEGHFFHRLPWSEVARQTGRSPDAARMLLNRALRRLRQELAVAPAADGPCP